MNHEVEVKILLSKAEYESVFLYANKHCGKTVLQTNYYYDLSSEGLRHQGLTLRVRTKGKKSILTLKVKTEKWENGAASEEYHFLIADAPTALLLADFPDLQTVLSKHLPTLPEALPCLGHLETERTRFSIPNSDLVIELDRSHYLDQTDYELECELSDRSQEPMLLSFLKETFGISPQKPVCGKYHRFLNRFHQIQDQ